MFYLLMVRTGKVKTFFTYGELLAYKNRCFYHGIVVKEINS